MTDNAIEAVQLSKLFKVPAERRTSLKERLVRGRAPQPKTFWALHEATFSVPRGSSLGLIGQNGSGKSTALKVLTGIYRPTSGHVAVNGSVSALLEVGAGFHPDLTGRENVRLNATILGFTNREIDRLIGRIIEFADVGEHIDAPIKHYSSGMYVRLGFAVAVMVRPEILLVDEVIAVGDEEFQRKCYEHLFDLRRAGTSMIIVSHGLGQITDLCDDAVWLERGRVMDHGPARAVVRAYLDSVNQKEASAEAVDEVKPVPEGIVRRGSGQVRVVSADVEIPGEGSARLLRQGAPGVFRIQYHADENVEDVRFELGVRNSEGIPVTALGSSELGSRRVAVGDAYVEFRSHEILLTGGPYSLSTTIKSGAHIVDATDEQFKFMVQSGGGDSGGTFLQPGSWKDPVRVFPEAGLERRPIIFVAGCPHSGTTVLATILGCSPDTTVIPRETGWFTHAMSGDEILAELQGIAGIPIEKTPNHVFHVDSIRAAFPNSRVVVIVRDPLDTISSLLARYGNLERALDEYLQYTNRVVELIEAGRVETVSLESIIEDFTGTIRDLCRRLGIRFAPQMRDFHLQAPDWFGVEPMEVEDREGAEHAQLRSWQVHQPLFDHRGRWRGNLAGADLSRSVGAAAALGQRLGYRSTIGYRSAVEGSS